MFEALRTHINPMHIQPLEDASTYARMRTHIDTCTHAHNHTDRGRSKGLGVTINANMEVSEQCRIAASQGNQILGMIRRNITYMYTEMGLIAPLYKAMVSPHLYFCIQEWRPYLRKDIDMLETTLETRRLRGGSNRSFF